MKQKIGTIIVALAVLIFLFLAVKYGVTVVKIGSDVVVEFDPVVYVDSKWASELLPAIDQKAVELSTILSEMKPDANGKADKDALLAIAKTYGLVTVGEAHVYMVKGSGKITGVDTKTSLGIMEVALDGYGGPIKVLIYIGTRIPSDETSVRDAVGMINFGDFKEQTQYGKVAAEINKRVLAEVLGGLDKDNLVGKTISFKGAFNIRTFNLIQIDLKEIYVVPTQIELGE